MNTNMTAVIAAVLLALCLPLVTYGAMSDENFVELCEKGTVQQVQDALKDGVNVNARDNINGTTALMYAIWGNEKNHEVVSLLLKAGADVNDKADNGMTSLMMAAQNNETPAVVSLLLEAGADVKARTKYGTTALMLAAINKHPKAVSLLLSAGSEINAQRSDGKTALMLAAISKDSETVSLLLEAGADVAIKDTVGRTARDYALEHGGFDIARLLAASESEIPVGDK